MTDIFVITSVICTGTKAWSYTSERSCFNHNQRFEQTLYSIASIRKYVPHAKIILVECSQLDENMTNELITKVDYFIQTYNITDIYQACHESEKKGFGEVMKMEIACKYIIDNNISFRRLFKLSGRYYLNDNFNETNYSNSNYSFKMDENNNGSTVLYSVPNLLFNNFIEKIKYCCNYYNNNQATGLETLLPHICTPLNNIKILGVSGLVGVIYDHNGIISFNA